MKFFVLFIVSVFVGKSFGKLPPSISRCQRNDPNMSQCIAKAIEELKPRLKSGDFGGGYQVPKLEPMFLKDLNLGQGQGLNIRLSDANVHGTSKFKVEKLRVNMKDLKFDAEISVPKLMTSAKYQMQFKFLGNNLKTNGDYFVEQKNVKIVISSKLKHETINGTEVVRFEPIQVKFDNGIITKLKLTNLFGGNKAIEEIIHEILMNNQEFIASNIRPVVEANLSRIFTDIANKIVESATFDEMFPLKL